MELLLVTGSFPHDRVTEFLDEEIHHLAEAFDRVRVAPMRPTGPITQDLPPNVLVDLSLSRSLAPRGGRSSRWLTAGRNLVRREGLGLGVDGGMLRADGTRASWLKQVAMARADANAVHRWSSAALTAPDCAYSFWMGSGVLGMRRAWPDIPIVTRAHGGDVYAEAHGWRHYPFQREVVEAADRVFCVSAKGSGYLRVRYPSQAARFRVRRLGIPDLGAGTSSVVADTIRILSISSIDDNKRVELIAAVVQQVARLGWRVEWKHLGDGPNRTAVEALINTFPKGVRGELSGHVPGDRVRAELTGGHWHVLVNLSRSEGAPVSLMEAQCAGLPVVATSVGGSPEVAPGDFNELVSLADGPESVARSVVRAAMGRSGDAEARRRHWKENFDADVTYPAFAAELLGLAIR